MLNSDDIFQLRLMPTERENDQAYLLGQNAFTLAVSSFGVSLSTKRILLEVCLLVETNMVGVSFNKNMLRYSRISSTIPMKDFIYACDPYDYFMYTT